VDCGQLIQSRPTASRGAHINTTPGRRYRDAQTSKMARKIPSRSRRGRDGSALRASSLRDRRRSRSGAFAAAAPRLVEPPC
jgi:hypothetical protein